MTQANVTIGKSDVESTPLGLGTNAVGGTNLFPNLQDQTGIEVVKAGLDNGIKLLDTAYVYGLGHSEELVGQAIKDYDRHSFALATKGAHDFSSGSEVINNDPEFLTAQVEASLKRLQTDYVDIYYIHFPDDNTPKAEAVGALQRLKEQGKIRAIGVSNFSLAQIKEANADGYVDVVEDEYSLLHQENAQVMMPYLKDHQISFVPYFPLASGLLTGKYTSEVTFADGDIRSQMPDFTGERFKQILAAVDQLRPIAANHNANVAQVVLAWYMQNPLVSVVIPGAKQPEQVVNNAAAMQIELSVAEYETIVKAFAAFK
ncbi:dehydrogenase [Lentilactobacillus senioris DSM 24302 = JCM 17472]|uniref:Dehydrogenase n=1 Tax=Lentilactobacillus senioris DSM 24302 = JCM 17472 TaxID=1423802 RepID=A0A0R2CQR5_9LACO|nr:aldo/keto reductase [Lentilactobacillus senioris]KRM94191.1 dehydrogenase [Lentilactobacillus senioris DSM 24302 = JCM 17472]